MKEAIDIVQKNQTLDALVEDITSAGDAVVKPQGYPIFVKGGVPGDTISLIVTKTNKSYGFGRINKIISPSPYRVQSPCPVFEKCGGCDFMHIAYEKQLEIKANTILNNMQKIGGIHSHEYQFEGIYGAASVRGYRNKAQLPVGKRKDTVVVGFYERGSHDIIPSDSCLIQDERINRLTRLFLKYANECKLSVYNEKSHKGVLRHLYIRTGNKTDESVVVIVTNSSSPLPCTDRLVNILQNESGLKGIVQNINTQRTNLILGKENRIIWGHDRICSKIDDLSFMISSESFFQVNGEQTEVLYSKALEYASPGPDETVFDLYCGVGSISLFLARKAKRVIGVEIVEKAIENARENASLNNIHNAIFHAGDCAEVVKRLLNNGEKADIVVVDPPRKGCSEESLGLINHMSPKKLVYVSCNNSTLARDVKLLTQYGYTLTRLCGVDMFPGSGHVESVALLTQMKPDEVLCIELNEDDLKGMNKN